jgi:CRP-like cAMP-binding protein
VSALKVGRPACLGLTADMALLAQRVDIRTIKTLRETHAGRSAPATDRKDCKRGLPMSAAFDRFAHVPSEASRTHPSFNIENFAARHGGGIRSAYTAGATLFAQGDVADHMLYIEAGRVQLKVVSSHGKEAILVVLEPGDFCGEGCLLDDPFRAGTASCMTDGAMVRLEKTSVLRAFRDDPQFAEFLFFYILNSRVRLRDSLISQLFDGGEIRLARVLVLLATHGIAGRGDRVIGHIGQEALAQMVGTTRSRINHFMNKFRRLGYIDYDTIITVHESLLSMVRHEDECDAQDVDGRSGRMAAHRH